MNILIALITGLIFGIGLIISGMTNPKKVMDFLDITGQWDPSLAFVMIGAIAVTSIAFVIAKQRSKPICSTEFQIPSNRTIDKRLVGGSLVFGIGWGIAGICPGPAFVLVGTGSTEGVLFLISLLIGMFIFELIERYRAKN